MTPPNLKWLSLSIENPDGTDNAGIEVYKGIALVVWLSLVACQIIPTTKTNPSLSPSPANENKQTSHATHSPQMPSPIATSRLNSLTDTELQTLKNSQLLDGYNHLAFELLRLLSKDLPKDQNLVFSPLAIAHFLTQRHQSSSDSEQKNLSKILGIEGLSQTQIQAESELLKRYLENKSNTEAHQTLFLRPNTAFNTHWRYPFYTNQTQAEPFQTAGGVIKSVPFMQINPHINPKELDGTKSTYFAESLDLQALGHSLHSGFELWCIVPQNKSALAWAQTGFYGEWYALKSALKERTMGELSIPRWQESQNHPLTPLFTQWGLPTPTEAFHSAQINVNERGINTQQSRATDQILGIPANPIQFKLNRPFVYTLHDSYTNAILYMGIVNDPSLP
jgi:serine protease inhibitor